MGQDVGCPWSIAANSSRSLEFIAAGDVAVVIFSCASQSLQIRLTSEKCLC